MMNNNIRRLERWNRLNLLLINRRILRDRSNPFEDLNDIQFKKRYRFFKDDAMNVFAEISENLKNNVTSRGLPPVLKFLIALQYFACGTFQSVVGDCLNISQASVSRVVKEVSTAISQLRGKYISFPTHLEAQNVHRQFYAIASFPGVIGAIDGTHIPIEIRGILRNEIELFYNYKKFYSINVQAICGPDMQFLSLVVRWYGSAHDARIFDNSLAKARLECNAVPGLLLGDSAYPCLPYLMTPISSPSNRAEENYNHSHKKTRNIIERTFGVWKRIFACLKQTLRTNIDTSRTIVIACAVLFNFNRRYRLELLEIDDFQDDSSTSNEIADSLSGIAKRNAIISQHFNTS